MFQVVIHQYIQCGNVCGDPRDVGSVRFTWRKSKKDPLPPSTHFDSPRSASRVASLPRLSRLYLWYNKINHRMQMLTMVLTSYCLLGF